MQYITTYILGNDANKLSSAEVEKISFKFAADLVNLQCCKKADISDGCKITFANEAYEEICNNCLYDLFIELSEKIRKTGKESGRLYEIKLPNRAMVVSSNGLSILKGKLNKYFCALYKQHIRDDLFKDETTEQRRFLEKARARLGEPSNEYKYTNPMSQGDKRKYFNKQHILSDLTRCYTNPITIFSDRNKKNYNPIYNVTTYSSISDVPCRIDEHGRFEEAVFAITDGRDNGFTFSFCPEHLRQFAMLLMKFYLEGSSFSNYSYGVFRIEKIKTKEACYLTCMEDASKFKVHFNKCAVILSSAAIKNMAVSILTSVTFNELYPIEAAQFDLFRKRDENNLTEELQSKLKEERETSKNDKARMNDYYNGIIAGREDNIAELEQSVKSLTEENSKMSYKLKHLDKTVWEEKKKQSDKIKSRILNCRRNDNVATLGISQKNAANEKVVKFKFTFAYGMSCSTFNHFSNFDEAVLLETGRKNDQFCFALCPLCVDILLVGLEAIHNKNYYINEDAGLEIAEINSASGMHCYACGHEGKVLQFIFGNKRFALCRPDAYLLETQLKQISNQFAGIHKFGGLNSLKDMYFFKPL